LSLAYRVPDIIPQRTFSADILNSPYTCMSTKNKDFAALLSVQETTFSLIRAFCIFTEKTV
jgi:hypothetical protein